ncbi:hypothetical protein CEXT_90161 [Caerostris extrusa]|uniref:Uncharacterized protein n=1 Tax=Caerostris extrusa TaxID=172846 RepID=A0AAV4UVK0_CAEEX|nr:hypothetical protein CEXT_90161 [Caerostris extrusa]
MSISEIPSGMLALIYCRLFCSPDDILRFLFPWDNKRMVLREAAGIIIIIIIMRRRIGINLERPAFLCFRGPLNRTKRIWKKMVINNPPCEASLAIYCSILRSLEIFRG